MMDGGGIARLEQLCEVFYNSADANARKEAEVGARRLVVVFLASRKSFQQKLLTLRVSCWCCSRRRDICLSCWRC